MKFIIVSLVAAMLSVGCTNTDYVHTLEADNTRLKQEVEVGAARLDEVRAEASKDATLCEKAMSMVHSTENSAIQGAKDAYAAGKPAIEKALGDAYEASKPVVIQGAKAGAAGGEK